MAGAAKSDKKGIRAMTRDIPLEKYEAPSTAHVNVKVHPKMGKAEVGKKMKFHGMGKVTRMSKDEFGHSISMDIHHMEPAEDA